MTDAGRRLAAIALLVALLVGGIGAAALAGSAPPEDPSNPVALSGRLDALHDRGVTGEGVTVGVVGVTGFDRDHPAIADSVVDARAFGPGGVANGGANDHGTAAASLVVRTAPDADLYLATFDTGRGFRDAVRWLVREDVDVVVAPVGFYGKRGDGSARVSRVARRATREGVTVVAPTGNLGRGHWQGRLDPSGGVHEFAGGERNYLFGDGSTARLWLRWNDSDRDLTLELYRASNDRLVARSQPYRVDGVPNERVVAAVDPDASYYVRVRGPANASGLEVELSSPTHRFQYRERAGSVVAPATADSVVAVGAYDRRNDRVEPFSSAGPVAGRPGVDVVAPDRLRAAGEPGGLVGSSAAAPYVAGVAALALDANPDLGPRGVATVLEDTAVEAGRDGVDPVAGHGRVAPQRAVRRARNATQGEFLVMPDT